MQPGVHSTAAQTAMRHDAAICAIAGDFQRPVAEVRALYQDELANLLAGAAIADFLPILAEKHVRASYRDGVGATICQRG